MVHLRLLIGWQPLLELTCVAGTEVLFASNCNPREKKLSTFYLLTFLLWMERNCQPRSPTESAWRTEPISGTLWWRRNDCCFSSCSETQV